eukprot:gene13702-biopygen16669
MWGDSEERGILVCSAEPKGKKEISETAQSPHMHTVQNFAPGIVRIINSPDADALIDASRFCRRSRTGTW